VRLSVLGSGSAFSGCGCNAGYLVDGALLVDCGAPVNMMAQRLSAAVSDVRLILLTHFHADRHHAEPLQKFLARHSTDSLRSILSGQPAPQTEFVPRDLPADRVPHSIEDRP